MWGFFHKSGYSCHGKSITANYLAYWFLDLKGSFYFETGEIWGDGQMLSVACWEMLENQFSEKKEKWFVDFFYFLGANVSTISNFQVTNVPQTCSQIPDS
jgi:hypothetical protein